MNTQLPHCLGFIMDGNRRWAKEQGLPSIEGHRRGADVLYNSIQYMHARGIAHVVYYTFSTENWNRSDEEVQYLMDLFRTWLAQLEDQFSNQKNSGVNIRIIGRLSDLPEDIRQQISGIEEKNTLDAVSTIWLALSYGGRAEIVEAVNTAVTQGTQVDEKTFSDLLWTADMPDPDMIVRPGGEKRLSNFLTWKSVYSELHFIDTYWPALGKEDFDAILDEYAIRNRRHGT